MLTNTVAKEAQAKNLTTKSFQKVKIARGKICSIATRTHLISYRSDFRITILPANTSLWGGSGSWGVGLGEGEVEGISGNLHCVTSPLRPDRSGTCLPWIQVWRFLYWISESSSLKSYLSSKSPSSPREATGTLVAELFRNLAAFDSFLWGTFPTLTMHNVHFVHIHLSVLLFSVAVGFALLRKSLCFGVCTALCVCVYVHAYCVRACVYV